MIVKVVVAQPDSVMVHVLAHSVNTITVLVGTQVVIVVGSMTYVYTTHKSDDIGDARNLLSRLASWKESAPAEWPAVMKLSNVRNSKFSGRKENIVS